MQVTIILSISNSLVPDGPKTSTKNEARIQAILNSPQRQTMATRNCTIVHTEKHMGLSATVGCASTSVGCGVFSLRQFAA